MRIADYLADSIYKAGVKDVFIVTGGGLMFLTDGLACHPFLRAVPCLHEQAAAMAAISYSQYRHGFGCCYVTTGCGGTNTITGVLHAWQDHVPVLYVSGQCNRNEMMTSVKAPVRQIGLQEANIVAIVSSITKYSVTIMDPNDFVYHYEKAMYLASHGNPGPVWLDVPMDVQEADIDVDKVRHYVPPQDTKIEPTQDEMKFVAEVLNHAERPMVIYGQGVRLAGAQEELIDFLERYQIPAVATRLGVDLIPRTNKLCIGLMDTRGTRAANFAVQNSDVILCIGSRLAMASTGYNKDLFLREAKHVIVVDVDENEHKKGTVNIEKVIISDAKKFLEKMPTLNLNDTKKWVNKCNHWKEMWPMILPEHLNDTDGISKFGFIDIMNHHLKDDSVVITDAGATTEIPMQALWFSTTKQRYLGSGSQCEMGYAIPATVGASIAKGHEEVFTIVGDGSLQMNIQELQTIITQKLPVKIFVWNNGGYGTIRAHQKTIFKGRFLGVDPSSGTSFPDMKKIADAYGFIYYKTETLSELDSVMNRIKESDVPTLVDIICKKEEINPQVKAKLRMGDGSRIAMSIEDMYPFIPREEFTKEMIITPVVWWK